MNNVKILTDAASDIPVELLDKYEIGCCSMKYSHKNVIYDSDLRCSSEELENFYQLLRGTDRIFTIPFTVQDFTRKIMYYLDRGQDLVYVGCSSKQSECITSANLVVEQLRPKYPDRKIYVVDSLNASIGEGILAVEAAKLAKKNKTADEIKEWLEANRKKIFEFLAVPSLGFLMKAGKVNIPINAMGSFLGLKPILYSDPEGYQRILKIKFTQKSSINQIITLLKQNISVSKKQIVYLAHSYSSDTVPQKVVAMIKAAIPGVEVCIANVGIVVGASVGPNSIGVWGFCNDFSFE